MGVAPGYRPLYRQVYDLFVKRIAEGVWKPAEALPSEYALADELDVSQGTIRKALDALASEGLVERRQGKGTFIAEHTQERALFRFFRLSRPSGERLTPTSGDLERTVRTASADDRSMLDLEVGDQVLDIRRTRFIDEQPRIYEKIVIPLTLFGDISDREDLPNTLYSLYQADYGVSVVAAEEELSADMARKEDTQRLGIALGSPLLHIDRIAIAVDGRKVEWRTSRCDTTDLVYAVTIR